MERIDNSRLSLWAVRDSVPQVKFWNWTASYLIPSSNWYGWTLHHEDIDNDLYVLNMAVLPPIALYCIIYVRLNGTAIYYDHAPYIGRWVPGVENPLIIRPDDVLELWTYNGYASSYEYDICMVAYEVKI